MFLTGVSPYPVERTLLVTGALDLLMDSKHQGNVQIPTPQLSAIAYPAPEQELIRPTNPRPVGASTLASDEFLGDYAPQYVAGEFPAYLMQPQPFKSVPRL